ncbi:HAD-IC family P-type ATPase [Clostridium kluyveri]|uniref:HAD-IC family P-type ATPase n=1 Tax=Clostridium kluyveri TaxID=1534 RepID=UPI0022484B09|nr:HAD-IC family P-type ATPase [Clostridium kluyveri]UZQ50394.1 HAD-IC family P-type ATPase [Clostridium kluyveri]
MKEVNILPGRIRFKTNKIYRNKVLAKYTDVYIGNIYGVKYSNVSCNTGSILIIYDEAKTNMKLIKHNIEQVLSSKINYDSKSLDSYNSYYEIKKKTNKVKTKLVWSGLVYLLFRIKNSIFGKSFISSSIRALGTASVITIVAGYPFLKNVYKKFTKHIYLNSEFILKLAAMCLTVLRESTEGLLLIALIDFNNYIKLSADLKCQKLLKHNMVTPPNTAWIITSTGDEMLTSIHSVQLNDIIYIHKGELVPAEGEVLDGSSFISNFYRTGQPTVFPISKGNTVYQGTVVLSGNLKVRITKIPQVLNKDDISFEQLNLNKRVVKFQDRIVVIAALLGITCYIFTRDILNVLSIILVLCPESSELALNTGIKNYIHLLSKYNIYLRNPNTFEKIIDTDSIVFDKTGTLTYGNMEIIDIQSFDKNYTDEAILKICSSCEASNYHPISNTFKSQLQKLHNIDKMQVAEDSLVENEFYRNNYILKNVQNSILIPSKGVKAVYNNHTVLIGNDEFFMENNIALDEILDKYLHYKNKLYTPILISLEGKLTGMIIMRESIRHSSYELIPKLKLKGITNLSLLTSDSYDRGKYVSDILDINNIYGDCNDEEKLKIIEKQKIYNIVMMVGDGLNDVSAMRAADVSVSFADSFCDQIKLNSDCIIFEDNMGRLNDLITLSKSSYKIIDMNIKIANLYNITFGALALMGGFSVFAAKSINTINSILVLILNERIKWIFPKT